MNRKIVELQDACEFLDNQRVPITDSDRKPGPYPYYGANGLQDMIDKFIFDEPLVLLAEDGGYFGSKTRPIAYKVTGKCWVNNHAHVLRPKPDCDVDYLHRILSFYDVTRFINGTTREKLTKGQAERIPIPLPPLPEQKRLSAILAKADRLRRLRWFALELSGKYLQTVFLEMFGDPVKNTHGWERVELADLVEAFEGGVNFNPVSENGPTSTWRVLKISSVTSGEFKPHESKAIAPGTTFNEALVVRKGDLIISRANTTELVGAVCMVRQTPPDVLLPDKLWRIKLLTTAEVNANYLLHETSSLKTLRRWGIQAGKPSCHPCDHCLHSFLISAIWGGSRTLTRIGAGEQPHAHRQRHPPPAGGSSESERPLSVLLPALAVVPAHHE